MNTDWLCDGLPLEARQRCLLLEKFVREHVTPYGQTFEEHETIPNKVWEQLRGLNLWQWTAPKDFGGAGITARELLTMMAQCGYGSAAFATSIAASLTAGLSIFVAGRQPIKDKFSNAVIAGGELAAFAFTEKQAGSDVTNIQTVAHRVKGGYEITGEKCFVTNGTDARHFVVAARHANEQRTSCGLSLFYIPRESPGLEIQPPHEKLGQRAVHTNPLLLTRVFVPEESRIGEEGEGLSLTMRVLQRSRISFAGGAIGICLRASDLVQEYLGERIQLRRSLLSQPVIRGNLAQLHTELEAAWQLACAAGKDWDNGETSLWRVNMAKLYAGQVAPKFLGGVMELFAGWGYTRSFQIEQLLRDVKFYEFVEGPAFVQQILIAKELWPLRSPGSQDVRSNGGAMRFKP